MHAAHVMRPRLPTLDYSQPEEETELIVPLMRRARAATPPAARTSRTPVEVARGQLARMPLVVDKNQLGEIMMVVRKAPPRVSTRVRRLSELVITARATAHRQQRHRVWMTRIGVLALVDLAVFVAARM